MWLMEFSHNLAWNMLLPVEQLKQNQIIVVWLNKCTAVHLNISIKSINTIMRKKMNCVHRDSAQVEGVSTKVTTTDNKEEKGSCGCERLCIPGRERPENWWKWKTTCPTRNTPWPKYEINGKLKVKLNAFYYVGRKKRYLGNSWCSHYCEVEGLQVRHEESNLLFKTEQRP